MIVLMDKGSNMNKLNYKKINRSKGSSTILVILIVLTIVLFGVINILTVYTSYKISQKNLKWTKEYYELDSKAQIFVNDLKKEIGKIEYGKNINQKAIIELLSQNSDKNIEILLNKNLIKFPIDKNEKIVQNNYIDIEVYFYKDEDEKKAFYINLKIPETKSNRPYEILSWKRVLENFEYDSNPEFSQGGEIIVQ